jgi:hypothetical protein
LAALAAFGVYHYEQNKYFTAWMTVPELNAYFKGLDAKGEDQKNYWEHGHWIERAEGRWHDGQYQQRMRFGNVPQTGGYLWYWWVCAYENEFQDEMAAMQKDGMILVSLQTHLRPDGKIRYASVWHKTKEKADLSHPISPPPFTP